MYAFYFDNNKIVIFISSAICKMYRQVTHRLPTNPEKTEIILFSEICIITCCYRFVKSVFYAKPLEFKPPQWRKPAPERNGAFYKWLQPWGRPLTPSTRFYTTQSIPTHELFREQNSAVFKHV